MRILYIFAGTRKNKFRGEIHKDYPDTQFYGLNHLNEFGVQTEYKEFSDVFKAAWLQRLPFNVRHALMFFATRKHDVVFGSALLPTMLFKKIFKSRAKYVLFNISLTRFLQTNKNRRVRMKIICSLFKEISAVVCLSQDQKKYLQKFDLLPAENIYVVHLGVDKEFYKPIFENREDFILSAGRDNGRDYQTVVDAARHIPNKKFVIVASPRNLADIENIPTNVKIIYDLPIQELYKLYQSAQMLLLTTKPQKNEGADCSGQTVLLEAMASGLPVIATRSSWIAEYVHQHKDILLVRNNTEEIINSIRTLEIDQKNTEQAKNARNQIDSELNTQIMAQKLLSIFEKLTQAICPVCSSSKYKQARVPEGSFFKCSVCKAYFIDPTLSPENLEKYYSDVYYAADFQGVEGKKRFKYRLNDIFRYIKPGSSILEIGAASGEFLSVLRNFGYDVQGVELSARASEVARKKFNIPVVQGDLESAAFKNQNFDAVLMYHVLEHVPDPKKVLKEIYRILKPGGVLIIEVPNPESLDSKYSKNLRKSVFDFPNHSILFPPKLLSQLVNKAGFKIDNIYTSFSYLISRSFKQNNKLRRSIDTQESLNHNKDKLDAILKPKAKESQLLIFKKLLSRLFPGMKLTCICIKNKP